MKSMPVLFLFPSLLATMALRSLAAEPPWIRFRGPNGCGASDTATIPTDWSAKDYRWRVSLPGIGYSSPLIAGGVIFATNGAGTSGKYLVAARPGIPEQGVPPEELYRIKEAVPYVPTPVARWPLVFLWSDRGVATCIDGPTGKVHWRERVGGEYLCSPVRVGQAVYCNSKTGEMVVLAAADKYKLLARIDLGEPTNSTPAVADGVLYLRTLSHLMALGGG